MILKFLAAAMLLSIALGQYYTSSEIYISSLNLAGKFNVDSNGDYFCGLSVEAFLTMPVDYGGYYYSTAFWLIS